MNEILQRIYSPGLILGGQRLHIIRQYTVHPIFSSNIRRGLQSLTWSPTIALSWLWGLGFFYSFHVTIEEGWIGFLCFALPNAVGLFVFGFVLGSERLDPAKMLSMVQVKYCSLFLLTQVLAVSITIFGFVVYLWQPLFLSSALAPIGVIILVGCAMGHLSSASTLKRLHVLYLCIGVSAALFALAALRTSPVQPSLGSLSSRFSGLLLPIVIGLLLGPWMDLQQWQRAVEIRRHGGSIRAAYGVAAVLFFAMLTLNALLAAGSGPAGQIFSADGIANKAPAVALTIARAGLGATAAYAVWAAIVVISTIDSSYVATKWMMKAITSNSNSPLFAFISPRLVSSPIWVVIAAILVASGALLQNLSMMYLMAPFGTLMIGAAVSLVADSLSAPGRADLTFAYLMGLVGALVLLEGYVHNLPSLEATAPLIALIGAAPGLAGVLNGSRKSASTEKQNVSPATNRSSDAQYLNLRIEAQSPRSNFDGQWFQMRLTPTYDDTNAVGNIYFANYIRWVGKARELFFNECMPDFDLSTTTYYVLTRSFRHEFRREAKEFEEVLVRLRIAGHNRKFVTLQHEIISLNRGVLGRGEQSLMFVDVKSFQPLDLPRPIIEGFLPYWPKSPLPTVDREVEVIGDAGPEGGQ